MQPDSHSLDEAVTAANVDLSNCDRELIHAPGLIQPPRTISGLPTAA